MKIVQSEAPAHEIHHTWFFSGRLNRTGGFRSPSSGKRVSPRSRGKMRPGLTLLPTLLNRHRVQGKPGAHCTRDLVCKNAQNAHTSIQVQRRHPAFPARGLRLTSRSPVTGFPVTVAPEKRLFRRDLTPASGCQGHTTSPVANSHVRRSWLSRPPHPTARS
jgi:hypothetical protein